MEVNPRIQEVFELIQLLAQGHLEARGKITEQGDELDGITSGLNMLAEELSANHLSIAEAERRMDEIMDVLISIASLDYTKKAKVSDAGDVFDALGTGLNTLSEELLETTVSRDFLDSVIQSMTESLIVVNSDLTIQSVNRALIELLDYSEEELIGKSLDIVFDKKSSAILEFDELLENGATRKIETFYLSKNGTHVPVSFSGSVMRNESGEIQGIVCVARDITDRKEAEKLLIESEAKYRHMIEEIPDIVYQYSVNKGAMYWSPAVKQVLGFDPLLFEKTPNLWIDSIHAKDQDMITKVISDSKKGKNFDFEYRIKDSRGKWHWFHDRSINVFTKEGDTIIEGIATDITDRKQAEEALRESEAKTRAILATLPDLIFQLDKKGKFLSYHASSDELYSSPEEFLGKNLNEIFPEELAKKTRYHIDEALNTDDVQKFDYELKMRDSMQHFEARMVSSGVDSVLVVTRNITERIQAENEIKDKNQEYELINEELTQTNAELRLSKEKAEESDRLKTAFLANISHEIRTPMNAIIGFSDLLQGIKLGPEETNQYIQIINTKGRELMALLSDLIDTSRIEAGDLKTEISPIDVNSFLQKIVTAFKEEKQVSAKSQIIIRLGLPENQNPSCNSDHFRLTQIFNNLLTNALKFTNEGYIEAGYNLEDHRIVFYVKDSGVGIPEDKITVIFERFRQADDSITTTYGGTGLGLSISKQIVEILGGEMWVVSAENQGSTFFFSLPINETVTVSEVGGTPDDKNAHIPELDLKNKKILIAEDDSSNYLFIESLLRKTGAEIIWARDGQQILDIHHSNSDADLIIMDIRMPEMNGLQATRKIRKYDAEVPIIALTAFASTDDHQKSLAAGCNVFLSKPVNLGSLIITIQKLLS